MGPAGSEQFVRCLSFTDPELLSWLRSQLRTARSFAAFTLDVDDIGLALLSESLAALQARDGRIRIVVHSRRAAAAALGVLNPGGGGLTVDVARGVQLRASTRLRTTTGRGAPTSGPRHWRSPGSRPLARAWSWTCGRTGSVDLDRLTGGLQAGDLWVVTGRSGVGKSVFALGLARNVAVRSRAGAALLAVRGSNIDTVTMLLSAELRIPLDHMRFGGLGDDDWGRLARRMGEIADAPLLLLSAEPGAAAQLRTAAERLVEARQVAGRHDLALLVVDDLPAAVTTEELLELKVLAAALGVCVVAVVDEDVRLPFAQIERIAGLVADVVVRMDREHDMTPGSESERAGEVDLHVLRNRRGPIAVIPMAFQGRYARLAELPTDSDPGPAA